MCDLICNTVEKLSEKLCCALPDDQYVSICDLICNTVEKLSEHDAEVLSSKGKCIRHFQSA